RLVSVARNGEVIVWDLVSGDPQSQSGSFAQSNGAQRTIDGGTANGATSPAAIAANSSPSTAARSTAAADSTFGAGDSAKASSAHTATPSKTRKKPRKHDWRGVTAMIVSPDGASLGTASFDGQVRVWDQANIQVLSTLPGP